MRPEDTLETLKEKAELAAILGTIQSTFTNFRYLRPIWKRNAEEERLLGVSMTGICDHPVLSKLHAEDWLIALKQCVIDTNKAWAEKLGINESLATTCVKPAGTTSSLSDTASGIHWRHSAYYIRTVRQTNTDPLTQFMKNQGIPWEPCAIRPESTTVFSFPIKAPDSALTRNDATALEHLNLWMTYNQFWAEHQVSITVNVREDEWVRVAGWVYDNFNSITGISFLPFDTGSYKQAPFQECTEQEYLDMLSKMPVSLDWSLLSELEKEDTTEGARELACQGGSCEIN